MPWYQLSVSQAMQADPLCQCPTVSALPWWQQRHQSSVVFIWEIDRFRYLAQSLLARESVLPVEQSQSDKSPEPRGHLPHHALRQVAVTHICFSHGQEGKCVLKKEMVLRRAWLVQGSDGSDSHRVLVRYTSAKRQGAADFSDSRNLEGPGSGLRYTPARPSWNCCWASCVLHPPRVRASFSFHVWIKTSAPWSQAQGKKRRRPISLLSVKRPVS